jgi:hypothetical protein
MLKVPRNPDRMAASKWRTGKSPTGDTSMWDLDPAMLDMSIKVARRQNSTYLARSASSLPGGCFNSMV